MFSGFMSSENPQPGDPVKKPVVKSAQKLDTAPPATEREADLYDLLAWFEVNKMKVAVAVLIATVVGFGIYTWNYFKGQKEMQASTDLLALHPSISTPTNTPPPQASAFVKIAQDYPKTPAGERAELLAASTLFTENKYPEAYERFSKFVNDHPQSPWVAESSYGQAAALEAMNKTNEAITAYQNVATGYKEAAVADDAKLAMARIYEAQKKPEQALRLYNELLPTGAAPGRAPEREEARSKRDALFREFPWLNTNKPLSRLTSTNKQAGTNATLLPATNAAAPAITPQKPPLQNPAAGQPTLTPQSKAPAPQQPAKP